MKMDFKSPRLYLLSSMIAAVPAIPLQLMAYINAYNHAESNYFLAKSPLPTLATAFSILSCLLAIAAIILWKRNPMTIQPPAGSFATFPAALGFLVGGALMFLTNTAKLTYILPVLCFLAAVYNIAIIFANKQTKTAIALVGFSAAIACILLNGYYYFDTTLEMNAPVKVTMQMAFLAAMIYFISEIRSLLDIELTRLYLMACALTVGIGSLVAIPLPSAYILGVFKPQGTARATSLTAQIFDHPEYLAGAAIILGVCITAAWKLCYALASREDKEDE